MYRFPTDFGPLHWALQRNREIAGGINEFSQERVCGEDELRDRGEVCPVGKKDLNGGVGGTPEGVVAPAPFREGRK